ncbi:hypothetical protein AKJ40_04990 [candidate division MSBL1 archaeon SCGC-AAA259M10]|uniref:Uncharacterized protein n=1 Tax=candidate division MSBL1 archaeon SCGC-AAA259M10 TaxID=1698270 RepID=A0A133UUV1_9EURY|nr:hypothetical protein AKJ40_04990 [candidate division MSBL1 archaeon SCGC-AAA259M10]
MLKNILLFIGLGFSNPVFPDMGSQFLTAAILETLIPEKLVDPLNCFLLKIFLIGLGIQKFEQKLENTEKFKIPYINRVSYRP